MKRLFLLAALVGAALCLTPAMSTPAQAGGGVSITFGFGHGGYGGVWPHHRHWRRHQDGVIIHYRAPRRYYQHDDWDRWYAPRLHRRGDIWRHHYRHCHKVRVRHWNGHRWTKRWRWRCYR